MRLNKFFSGHTKSLKMNKGLLDKMTIKTKQKKYPGIIQKLPKQLCDLLIKIAHDVPGILGNNLLGIYLHGSLTHSAFNEKNSDIDCIAAIYNKLTVNEQEHLRKCFKKMSKTNSWMGKLHMHFIPKKDILIKGSKMHMYKEEVFTECTSDANPIIWLDILDNGIIMFGPDPGSFIPKISKRMLHNSLKLELWYLKQELYDEKKHLFKKVALSYQVYAILTSCRICYTFENDSIVSKKLAGRWCAKFLDKQWRNMINRALKIKYGGEENRFNVFPDNIILNFIDSIEARNK